VQQHKKQPRRHTVMGTTTTKDRGCADHGGADVDSEMTWERGIGNRKYTKEIM